MENRSYRPSSSVEPGLEGSRESFRNKPVATAIEGAARIEEISGSRPSDAQVMRIMLRLGLVSQDCYRPSGVGGTVKFDLSTKNSFLARKKPSKVSIGFFYVAEFVCGALLGMIWSFTGLCAE